MDTLDRVATAVPAPTIPVSQATAIEQSRVVAEVQAQVIVAQKCPRDEDRAVALMKRTCSRRELAERAFFTFPRGGQTVSGPSIHLARELARCWGNVQYGVSELSRDEIAGRSEMQATAWDLQLNTRSTSIFIVPHRRDTKKGSTAIADLRDVYENNANNGARRVREAIFSVLPFWFVEEAQEVCKRALSSGTPEEQRARAAKAIENFQAAGITIAQLEERVGRPRMKWSPEDVTDLGILYQSLCRKEITREEAFPPPRVTLAELDAHAAAAQKLTNPQPAQDEVPAKPSVAGQALEQLEQQVAGNRPPLTGAEMLDIAQQVTAHVEDDWPEPAQIGGTS